MLSDSSITKSMGDPCNDILWILDSPRLVFIYLFDLFSLYFLHTLYTCFIHIFLLLTTLVWHTSTAVTVYCWLFTFCLSRQFSLMSYLKLSPKKFSLEQHNSLSSRSLLWVRIGLQYEVQRKVKNQRPFVGDVSPLAFSILYFLVHFSTEQPLLECHCQQILGTESS